jgi:magnesium-transporting ATPase (P-type)
VYNLKRLRHLAGASNHITYISPDGSYQDRVDSELVPGDRFVIPQGVCLPCDAILLTGRVTIDESMLTGESVPVNKTPIELGVIRSTDELSRNNGNILYSGTKVMALSGGIPIPPSDDSHNSSVNPLLSRPKHIGGLSSCIGVVYRTSFRSAKGQLVGAMLNPKESTLQFFSDALTVILLMFVICTLLYVWSAVSLNEANVSYGEYSCLYAYYITSMSIYCQYVYIMGTRGYCCL